MSVHKTDSIQIGDETYDFTPDNATQQKNGLMSAADKEKLDDLTAITSSEVSSIFSDL